MTYEDQNEKDMHMPRSIAARLGGPVRSCPVAGLAIGMAWGVAEQLSSAGNACVFWSGGCQ